MGHINDCGRMRQERKKVMEELLALIKKWSGVKHTRRIARKGQNLPILKMLQAL